MLKKITIIFSILWILGACTKTDSSPSDKLVNIGTHQLQIRQEGKGTPVVVIDAGLADRMDKLQPLQEKLARITTVVTYNRAGYGQSEPGPLPRNSEREAEELKTLLKNASVPEPFILVGHSLGALNMEVFASKYPDEVAGMVLLDPPPLPFILGREFKPLREMAERMTSEWQAIADSAAKSDNEEQKANAVFFRTIASEHHEMFGSSAKKAEAIVSFGDIPLVVMASGKPNAAFGDQAEDFQKFWVEQSRALAAKSDNGKFVLVKESSHFLYIDAPDKVADNIISMVREIRQSQVKKDR